MDKRFSIAGCGTCIGIAGAILLIVAAFLCGCTSTTQEQQATEISQVPPVPAGEYVPGTGAQDGNMVEVDYVGTFEDGTEFDSSRESGPFALILGSGGAIVGFENAIRGMEIGESKKFTLSPEEAYGEYDPTLIVDMPREFIPTDEEVTLGDRVTLFDGGQFFQATIMGMNETNVTFDLNSPLAGKTLTFDVTVVNITPIEIEIVE